MDLMKKIKLFNRKEVKVTANQFLEAFKGKNELIYYKVINEQTGDTRELNYYFTDNSIDMDRRDRDFDMYQNNGYGIYFYVNDGGTKKDRIKKIKAAILEFDVGKIPLYDETGNVIKVNGKTLYYKRTAEEKEYYKQNTLKLILAFSLCPSIIVETCNGFHIYWLIDDADSSLVDMFEKVENGLIKYFSERELFKEHVDTSVNTKNKVLRIPNYLHLKDVDNPYKIKCIYFSPETRYQINTLNAALSIEIVHQPIHGVDQLTPNSIRKSEINENIASSQKSDLLTKLFNIDLRDYLQIQSELNHKFCCIFHDDVHPSAQIKYIKGKYKYFCYADNCVANPDNRFRGIDIIDIAMIQHGYSNVSDATKYLIKQMGLSPDNIWLKSQMDKYGQNISAMNQVFSPETKYRHLIRILHHGRAFLFEVMDIAQQNLKSNKFKLNDEAIFYISNRYLALHAKKNVGKANKYINLFCVLGLIQKVPYGCIDKEIITEAKKQATKYEGRRLIGFYSIPLLTDDILEIAENRAKRLYENNYTIAGMGKQFIAEVFGIDFANSIYIQDKNVPLIGNNVQHAIEDYLDNYLSDYCYFDRKLLMSHPFFENGHRVSKAVVEYELKRVIPQILTKHNLVYIRPFKELKECLNLNTNTYVYVKKELITNLDKGKQ